MSLPPSGEIPQGAIRFNTDSQRLEFYAQGQWWIMSTDSPNLGDGSSVQEPGPRGIFAGGYAPSPVSYSNTIEYVNISSRGNSKNFGDMANKMVGGGGVGSRTRGLFAGGYINGSPYAIAQIDFVTIASAGQNAGDFGDLANPGHIRKGSVGNQTRGIWGGGQTEPGNAVTAELDYVTIAHTGSSVDFGALSVARTRFSGAGNATRGIFAGGFKGSPSVYYNTIDYVNITSGGTAEDFGDMTRLGTWTASCSNATRMLINAGDNTGGSTDHLEFLQIQTRGNTTEFGGLAFVVDTGTYANSAVASPTRGVFTTGLFKNPGATYHNTIYYVQINTQGRALDFGDLSEKRYGNKSCSNAHGGL